MKPRVLQICCTRAPQGVSLADRLALWSTVTDVAEAVSRAGAETTVLLDGPAADALVHNGVCYRQVPGLRRPDWSRPFASCAAGIARRHAPDVVHMIGLEAPVTTRSLSATGIPVLAQDHASRPAIRDAGLRRWGFARLSGVAFTAAAQAEPFLRAGQLRPATRIFEIPESSSHFGPGPRTEARALTGMSGAPTLLWVGHLDSNKNPLMVLSAVQRVISHLPQIALWCAFGDAPLRPEVDALLASDPELRARVHLLGRLPHAQMEMLYRGGDAFVSASRREGSGYALIEALACGLPAIVTDIPSFRALTGNGAVGALVPVDDIEAMAAAILRKFAGSSQTSEARRREVRRHFDAQLSFDVVGARLVDAYAVLIGSKQHICA